MTETLDYYRGYHAGLERAAKYHDAQAGDCRAIAAVNRDNDLGSDCETYAIDHEVAADEIRAISLATAPSVPLEQRWLPVSTYPNDNSVVLVANPDEGRLPVIGWKVEDKWFKYELTERQPLDPQPTVWTEWPKMPRASMVPLEDRS